MIKTLSCISAFLTTLCAAWLDESLAQRTNFSTYENVKYGYNLVYPTDLFQAIKQPNTTENQSPSNNVPSAQNDAAEETGLEDGRTFLSRDGRAKMIVFGSYNDDNLSVSEYRSTILREFQGYDNVTYGPKGNTWFVLSGFRGDSIYYQKVLFSCGGKIINALSITFPREQKPLYEPVIERLEDNFTTARGQSCNGIVRRSPS